MPAIEEKKVTPTGNCGAVVIPKPLRDYYKIKPGDKITVLYDSLMLVVPEPAKDILKKKKDLIHKLLK